MPSYMDVPYRSQVIPNVEPDVTRSAASQPWEKVTPAGFALQLESDGVQDRLRVLSPVHGPAQVLATLVLTPTGLELHICDAELHLHGSRRLRLTSPLVELEASEALRIRSEGSVESIAFEHRIESTHGDVQLTANDDVALDGERIRLNSPRPRNTLPPPHPTGGDDEGIP